MLAGLDKPLRLIGAVKTAEAHFGGGRSLQSHLQMNLVFTLSREGGAMPAKTVGVV